MLNIVKYPNPILQQNCECVTTFDNELRQFCTDMIDTMKTADGIGLAANQVGISKRIIVVGMQDEEPFALINPVIAWADGEQEREEGCLSFPKLKAKIKRAEEIHVEFYDGNGQPHCLTTGGLLSVCIQHEVDHLNGIVFIDKLSSLKKSRLLKKFSKIGT